MRYTGDTGAASAAWMLAASCGETVSSASRHSTQSCCAWSTAYCFCWPKPSHSFCTRPAALRRWRRALWSPAVWGELRAFRRALTAERYDAVIDSQALLKSAAICFWAAGTRHGMDAASAREPLAARFYDLLHTVSWRLHAVERNRRLTAEALR